MGLAPQALVHRDPGNWMPTQGATPKGNPAGGEYTRERLVGGCRGILPWAFPGVYPPPDGPPNTRGPLEVLVGPFTDFSDFLGRLLVIVEFHSHDYLFTWLHVFFQMMSSGGIR